MSPAQAALLKSSLWSSPAPSISIKSARREDQACAVLRLDGPGFSAYAAGIARRGEALPVAEHPRRHNLVRGVQQGVVPEQEYVGLPQHVAC